MSGPDMEAIVFEFSPLKLAVSKLRGLRNPSGHWQPGGAVSLKRLPRPKPAGDDWVILKTACSGICGSDMKELTLDGAMDNPLQCFLSFPQIMGHEVVGVVEETGARVGRLKPGDRVAVSPWLSCSPRGIDPPCPRCADGDYTHCASFRRGRLPAGMHLGVATGFGGFAEYVAVHESQCFLVPEGVAFEEAVLADPFCVAFHSCLLLDPGPKDTVVVYGLGIIGLLTVACLKELFDVGRIMAVGRHRFQKDLARRFGADHVFTSRGEALIEEVAGQMGAELYQPDRGPKWSFDGVDGIIDTIGTAETLAAGMRFITTRGRLVFTGVGTPSRCENTPHYIKEIEIIGSNAFAIEEFRGERAHAMDFFFRFLAEKRFDLSGLVTHRFALRDYMRAFDALADKRASRAVKVVFEFD